MGGERRGRACKLPAIFVAFDRFAPGTNIGYYFGLLGTNLNGTTKFLETELYQQHLRAFQMFRALAISENGCLSEIRIAIFGAV